MSAKPTDGRARRWILALLAVYHSLGALLILVDPQEWYGWVPGVAQTGPFNSHFVYDIGFAFLASGLGFALAVLRPAMFGAAIVASAFPALHALMHLWLVVSGATPHVLFEVSSVILPGALGVFAAWPRRGGSG